MSDETKTQEPDAPAYKMPSLIWAPVETHEQYRTKVTHNILAILGETADEVKCSLIALGCVGPQPITQLLIKLGFKSIDCTMSQIDLDDIMTGDRFWFQTPAGVVKFWESMQLSGEPRQD